MVVESSRTWLAGVMRLVRMVCLIVVATISFSGILVSQDVRAEARVDSNTIVIGDWLRLHLTVVHPEEVTLSPPVLPDSIEGIEFIDRSAPSSRKTDRGIEESVVFTITSFDSGTHVIPPISIMYNRKDDTARSMTETTLLLIVVRGMAIDTTQDIRDVKPPISIPLSFAEMLPYILGVILLGGVAWLIFYIRKKRRRGESLLPSAPARPADELALEALQTLEAAKLWQRGKLKEYQSQLTDILRIYVERRFRVAAMESTTDEILAAESLASLPSQDFENLRVLLVRADFTKFARYQPVAAENEESLSLARKFVESTRVTTPALNGTGVEPASAEAKTA